MMAVMSAFVRVMSDPMIPKMNRNVICLLHNYYLAIPNASGHSAAIGHAFY